MVKTEPLKIKKVQISEIRADLKSIETELEEMSKVERKDRLTWAKEHPESWTKIENVYRKYAIQYAIETLEELHTLIQERTADEKARCKAIISRTIIPF